MIEWLEPYHTPVFLFLYNRKLNKIYMSTIFSIGNQIVEEFDPWKKENKKYEPHDILSFLPGSTFYSTVKGKAT